MATTNANTWGSRDEGGNPQPLNQVEHGVNGRLNRDSNLEERLSNRKRTDEASEKVTDEGNGFAKLKGLKVTWESSDFRRE